MAPEQWKGTFVPATDQYALAVMMFHLLTGYYPFKGELPVLMSAHTKDKPPRPGALNPQLSEDIDRVLLRALEKDPRRRYPTIKDFAQDFAAAVAKAPVITTHPPVPQTPASPRPFHLSTLTIAIILTILLLLVTSSGIFFYVNHEQAVSHDATATASAMHQNLVLATEKALTATAHTNATATTIAQDNATATATVVASHYPFSANLVLRDIFNSSNFVSHNPNQWDIQADPTEPCHITPSGYLITDTTTQEFVTCSAENTNYGNFTYQADMKIEQGDCAGIFFRSDSAAANFYIFLICSNGFYRFGISTGTGTNVTSNMTSDGKSPNIRQGTQVNTIAVVAQGSLLTFYINNPLQPVYTMRDATFTTGKIGLLVYPLGHASKALFLNARVWQLPA